MAAQAGAINFNPHAASGMQAQDGANNYNQQVVTKLNNQTSRDNTNTQANSANYQSQLGYNANMAGINQQNRALDTNHGQFEQVFGLLSNNLTNPNANASRTAGTSLVGGPQPTISAAPIWNQQQINQQVNGQNANVDAQVASQTQGMHNSLAGRGFGSNSALSSALEQGYQGQGLQTKVANDQSTRWNAAQGNAQQVLSAQQAQEQQYANRNQEANQRFNTNMQYNGSLAAALAGMSTRSQ